MDITQVLTGCQEGDPAAIEALVHTFRPHVYRFALSILRDPIEADEAAQDSIVTAIDKLGSYRREASFKTWLFAITLNTCRGRLRKRKVREKLLLPLAALLGRASQGSTCPEETLFRNEARGAIWRAINALDQQHREILVLRYYHDLGLNEIARIVGVSDRTIRTRLHAARERLQVLLREEVGLR